MSRIDKWLEDKIENCKKLISELDLSNPDKRTKNWKRKRGLENSIKFDERTLKIRKERNINT